MSRLAVPSPLSRLAWQAKFHLQPARYAVLEALRQQQWLTPTALEALQRAKLQQLIQHAYANVPYYRRVMDERGVRPEQIRSAEDLGLLPLLTKEIIRAQGKALRAERGVDQPSLVRTNHTGGSTGTPLAFDHDERYRVWTTMEIHRNFEMCGYRLGDPIAFLWGSDPDARPHATPKGRLRDVVENRLFLNAFDGSERIMAGFARQLARFRPRLLVGYVSSLTLLARTVQANDVRDLQPAAIQSSAETLTDDQRQFLESTFGCPVFDRYGCREVGNIAHECSAHRGLHLLADNNVTELLRAGRPAAPGEVGEVVVTNLNNYVMPFIRYVNGDAAIAAEATPCPCGRGQPLIRAVRGRMLDIITTPSGKLLPGEFFPHLFRTLDGVAEFQVVQHSRTQLDVAIVPTVNFDEQATTSFVRDVITKHGDSRFEVRVSVVPRIPRSDSGKFRVTISHVPVELAVAGASNR